MGTEGRDRGDGFDDLFEELDDFFASGPDAEARRRRRSDESTASSETEAAGGGNEDLLPPGWKPDIEGLDMGPSEQQEAPPPEEAPRRRRRRRKEKAPQPAAPAEQEPAAGEPSGEMTGEDWTRLRNALGEEPAGASDEEVGGQPPGERSPDDLLGGEDERRAEEVPEWLEPGAGHELTLEDLKKAPPEYRELPTADEEPGDRLAAGEAEPTAAGAGGEAATEESEERARAASAEPDRSEDIQAAPTMDEIEAAADHFAEDLRDSEAEPRVVEEELLADLEEPAGPRTVKVGTADTLTGPTWEEPTSRPITAEPTSPAAARDMPAALMTAGALAVVALVFLWISKAAFVVIAGGVVLLGQAEFYATMTRKGHRPATLLGLAVGALSMAGAYLRGEPATVFFVAIGLFLTFLWYMAAPLKSRENLLGNIGATLLGVLYGPFLAGFVFMLLAQRNSGRALMLLVIALAFLYDIAAYAVGSFWGSRPLAPTISPRKSWEGVLGGTVVTLAVTAAAAPNLLDYFSLTKGLGLGIVVVIFAPLGDLIESLIKRDLGVKDMGSVLPGHGGVFDRLDSVLLVAPAVFYYLRLIF